MTKKEKCMVTAAAILTVVCAAALALQPAERTGNVQTAHYDTAGQYTQTVSQRLSGMIYGQKTMVYRISDTAPAAPVPDENCYGQAETYEEFAQVLERAADILEGQTLFLSAETELLEDTPIRYYLDETIFAVTWKQLIERTVFTFSEVKIRHPSQFRRYLSGGEFASGKLELTSQMAAGVNAVVAGSGDYYAYRRKGYTVVNGAVCKSNSGLKDICFVDRNGDLRLTRDLSFGSADELQAYVDENDINFTLSFGPILILDGEYACPRNYSLGEVKQSYPRAAICQMDTLHYLYAASNMDAHHYNLLKMDEFAQALMLTGCRQAYALDGGQTATVVMHNELVNNVNYGSERLISDIIYFATAKPAGE